MDPTDAVASGSHSRQTTMQEARMSVSARSEDDYDLSAHAIADGFRPFQPAPAPGSVAHDDIPSVLLNLTTQLSPRASLAPPKACDKSDGPSSASKNPLPHDSLTLRNDGSGAIRRRPVSPGLAATDTFVERPYRGPLGPSHPYAIYSQRTFSIATSSIAPNSDRQSYAGTRGPAHPYALYTQTTVSGEDAGPEDVSVGFAGMGTAYQRQLGPEGEEAGDMIGPLGHLEALPPYTRYPEDSHARSQSSDPTNCTLIASGEAASHAQTIPGAGGLGMATRNPEFSSTEEDLHAQSRHRPVSRSASSQHEINIAARDITEKATMSKWQRRARRRLWGIVPYWVICLVAAAIVIFAVVLGTVIGNVLLKKGRHNSRLKGELERQATNFQDTKPLQSVPPDLAPLAVGSYSIPPLETSQAPKSCFTDPTQAPAWSCDIPFRFYSMDVARVPGAPDTRNYQLTLSAINASNSKFIWGAQPPNVPDPQPLTLVNDSFEERRGPAWSLRVQYEKTVIVAEDQFQGKMTRRYDGYSGPDGESPDFPPKLKRKYIGAKDRDKPWICTWPNTTLEIFIYPNQNVSIANPSSRSGVQRDGDISDALPEDGPVPMPAYPKVVKFLERRWCTDPKAVVRCRQVEVEGGGRDMEDIKGADGKKIEMEIAESWKQKSRRLAARGERWRTTSGKGLLTREVLARDLELTDCGCLWWST